MSALRLGRLPDGTRHVLILEPAVGRTSFTRYGIRGGGGITINPVTIEVRPIRGETEPIIEAKAEAVAGMLAQRRYKAREKARERRAK